MKVKLLFLALVWVNLISVCAQEHFQLDANLKLFSRERPGLIGFLGDPTTGHQSQDQNLSWLPSGLLLSQSLRPYGSLRLWSNKDGDVRFVGTLNASGEWAVSADGALICSQVPKMESDPTAGRDKRFRPHGLVCHRFSDKTRLWKWEPDTKRICDVSFSPDGKKVAVAVHKDMQLTVCFLDALTGKELQQVTIPGVHGLDGSLLYHQDAIWVMAGTAQDRKFFRLSEEDLKPEPVLMEKLGGMHSSLDEQWLAIVSAVDFQTSYQVYQREGQSWRLAFQGDGEVSDDGGYLPVTAALFSPDGRCFFVSSRNSAKLISLPDGKLLKSFSTGCLGAAFSPKGDILLLAQESGFTRLDTRTWTPIPAQTVSLHQSPVRSLLFLDGGKRLLSHAWDSMVIWDLASRKAAAVLQCDQEDPGYSVPALVNQGRELISSDCRNFIRWTLPEMRPVNGPPQVLKGSQAFTGPAMEEMSNLKIFADDDGSHVITGRNGRWFFRESHEKSRVLDLKTLGRTTAWPVSWATFLSGDRVASFASVWMAHIDLTNGSVIRSYERNPSPWGEPFQTLPSDRKLCAGGSSRTIRIFDPETGQAIREFSASGYSDGFTSTPFGPPAAFSSDGSLMTTVVTSEQFEFLFFWDARQGIPLGGIELKDDEVTCLAFTPDSKGLAAGHHNRSISLWNVQKVLASLRPESELLPKAPPPQKTKTSYVMSHSFPGATLQADDELKWSFRSNGSIQVGETLPSFGELKVQDEVIEGRSRRFWNRSDGQLGSSFVAMVEGETKDGKIAVSRLFQRSTCLALGYDAIDGVSNLSAEPRTVAIEFSLTLPAGCQRLQTESQRTIECPTDGVVRLEDGECWLAASDAFGLDQPFPAIRVRSWSALHSPELLWDKSSQVLKMKYQVELKPYEMRWLNHCLAFVKRPEGGAIDDFEIPKSADFCHAIGWGEGKRGINFGQIHNGLPDAAHGFLSVWSPEMKFELEKDSFGFVWDATYGGGRSGELGAEQLFAPWIEERPFGFGGRSMLRGRKIVDAKLYASSPCSFGSLDEGLSLYRTDFSRADYPVTVWQDMLKNNLAEEKEFRLSYMHSFASPVTEIVDNHGRVYRLDQLEELNASKAQACAFVIAGDARPATLITLTRQGGKIHSSLRRMSDGVFAQDYRITIGPSSAVALLHAACQRPLSAFANPEEAFADLLSMRKPTSTNVLDKFNEVRDGVPILNGSRLEP
ncbi:WD40 repeat [Prosthecobacter debontii]|uniref:WD40 repeat n=1 Tax=Prosthecobacter debontii TaxID=48467 RepID=A0A1T4YSD1_9BACT|nr:hypothetical protein [Prosthecobacter debontii]SKB04652.1 WD40 repeat [Prosthecobacter debontii]